MNVPEICGWISLGGIWGTPGVVLLHWLLGFQILLDSLWEQDWGKPSPSERPSCFLFPVLVNWKFHTLDLEIGQKKI